MQNCELSCEVFIIVRGVWSFSDRKNSREKTVASILCPLIAAHYSLVILDAHSSSFYRDLSLAKWRK